MQTILGDSHTISYAHPVPPAKVGRTLTEDVYGLLRADILAGRLEPGSRLKFQALQTRYGTSVGVMREALVRMAEQGLVRSEPQVGFTVATLSVDDLVDLTAARTTIECLVFRQAIESGSVDWEMDVLGKHHRLSRTPVYDALDPQVVSEAWGTAHMAFHLSLLDGCPNTRLRDIAAGLRDNAELYRSWSQSIGGEPERDVAAEHQALLDSVLARDADRGVEVLRDHIQHTADLLVEHARHEERSAGNGTTLGD